MKIYCAIKKRKNGRLEPFFGLTKDPDEIGRNLNEEGELKNYNIAELETKILRIIPNTESYYWEELNEALEGED